MDAVLDRYGHQLSLEILVGGLRPGNRERFDEQRRNYILGHWKAVSERTGQPFNFAFQMNADFTYDTEPASRAVVTVRSILPDRTFPIFKAIQHAFYVENQDVTQESTLAEIAMTQGIEQEKFLRTFQDPLTKQQEWDEFAQCRELGITGFPSLLGRKGESYTSFTQGYTPFDQLISQINKWMTG